MCGGAGTRLWPASRQGRPKQFLPLFGTHSMLQDTVQRVTDPTLFGRPIIVTNDQYRFVVAEQLAAIGTEADILLEPVRRDSGPAIAAGAAFAAMRDENTLLVALAADHAITDPAAFVKICRLAAAAAGADRIVTFGIRPTRPATEYGYIRAGASIGADIFAVEKFIEKPDANTAERYVKEGYLWNSGNFMFRAELLSWQAVWELSDRDTLDNCGQGPAVLVDTRGSYVASDKQLVALLGVENLVVVTTDDAVLVAKRKNSDGLRRLVQELKKV